MSLNIFFFFDWLEQIIVLTILDRKTCKVVKSITWNEDSKDYFKLNKKGRFQI